jgi:hypothetical protein
MLTLPSKFTISLDFILIFSNQTKPNYNLAKNLVKSIRSGRKVFKLLKFLDEYKEMCYQFKNFDRKTLGLALTKLLAPKYLNGQQVNAKVIFANFLLTLTKASSFVYYLLDNLMWVANVGMLGPAIFDYERWKFWKKVFNLIRNYTQLIRAILLYKINARKLQKQKNELDKYDS